jgi:hypothetical protein
MRKLAARLAVNVVLIGMSCIPAQAQTSAAAALQPVLRDYLASACDLGPARLTPESVLEADLDGDGAMDAVLDPGFIACGDGARPLTCGFRACEIVVFMNRDGRLVETASVLSIGVGIIDGTPPRLELMSHNFEETEWMWDGAGFSNPPSTTAITKSAEGVWAYGEHPILGLTAHIDFDGEAMGIACSYFGDNPAMSELAAIRVTPGLATDGKVTIVVEPNEGAGTNHLSDQGRYWEKRGNSCDLNTLGWRNGSSISILDTEITGFGSVDNGVKMILADGQEIMPGEDALAIAGGISVPLKGSAAAIDKLLRSCPMLQQDIDWNCGI